jgi:hypothetical protein
MPTRGARGSLQRRDSWLCCSVNVVDYRYVSVGARVAFGIITGNAFINAQVGFRDLKTGETWATQTYDTKSSAWNGVFAAMTTKQVRAMCHEILGEVSAH